MLAARSSSGELSFIIKQYRGGLKSLEHVYCRRERRGEGGYIQENNQPLGAIKARLRGNPRLAPTRHAPQNNAGRSNPE